MGVVNRLGKSPLVIAQEQRNKPIMQMLTVEEGKLAQRDVRNYLVYNQVRHTGSPRQWVHYRGNSRGGAVVLVVTLHTTHCNRHREPTMP